MRPPLTNSNKLHYSLSMDEMKQLNPDAEIITYPELNKITNIKTLFKNCDKLIILYLLEDEYTGHWVCLFKNYEGFNFFDSYGFPMSYEVDVLPPELRRELNQQKQRLNLLLKPYRVIYNNIQLQKKNTETCGMFVTHRLHYDNLNTIKYINGFKNKNKISPDEIVATYCLKLLKKKKI